VEGGKEANGAAIYIARVKYNGGVHTAKIGEHLPAAHLAFSGEEVLIDVGIRSMLRETRRDSDALAVGLRSVVLQLNEGARRYACAKTHRLSLSLADIDVCMISDCRAIERHWQLKTFESLQTAEIYFASATYLYSPTWLCGAEALKTCTSTWSSTFGDVGAFLLLEFSSKSVT
jgi:hypothetical protein